MSISGAGYQLGLTVQFVLLCPVLLLRNEPEAALEVIDHGLSIVSHNSERFFEAELYRLKARALLMRGAPDAEVESLLNQALRTARSQQARSLELRAATDLARLWMNQGKRAEALDVLIHPRPLERRLRHARPHRGQGRTGPAAMIAWMGYRAARRDYGITMI